MKKSFILPILILFLTSSLAYPQQDEFTLPIEGEFEAMYITKGMMNGRHWQTFKEREKTMYLFGFQDGVMNIAIHYLYDTEIRDKAFSSFPSTDFKYLIKEMDEFYSDNRNLHIPINYILLIIRNRMIDVDENKIQKYIEYLRNPDEDLKKVIQQAN